jgi:hypothetical protein
VKVSRGRPAAVAQELEKAHAFGDQAESQVKFLRNAGDDDASMNKISNFRSIPPFIASEIVSMVVPHGMEEEKACSMLTAPGMDFI